MFNGSNKLTFISSAIYVKGCILPIRRVIVSPSRNMVNANLRFAFPGKVNRGRLNNVGTIINIIRETSITVTFNLTFFFDLLIVVAFSMCRINIRICIRLLCTTLVMNVRLIPINLLRILKKVCNIVNRFFVYPSNVYQVIATIVVKNAVGLVKNARTILKNRIMANTYFSSNGWSLVVWIGPIVCVPLCFKQCLMTGLLITFSIFVVNMRRTRRNRSFLLVVRVSLSMVTTTSPLNSSYARVATGAISFIACNTCTCGNFGNDVMLYAQINSRLRFFGVNNERTLRLKIILRGTIICVSSQYPFTGGNVPLVEKTWSKSVFRCIINVVRKYRRNLPCTYLRLSTLWSRGKTNNNSSNFHGWRNVNLRCPIINAPNKTELTGKFMASKEGLWWVISKDKERGFGAAITSTAHSLCRNKVFKGRNSINGLCQLLFLYRGFASSKKYYQTNLYFYYHSTRWRRNGGACCLFRIPIII